MAKLIYLMNTSLDWYTEDQHGRFGWGATEDDELHSDICEFVSSFRTCLYGRKMYEMMVYWETADQVRDQPHFLLEFARQWQAAERSSTRGPSLSRAAHGQGSSANSIPMRSGGSRPTLRRNITRQAWVSDKSPRHM